MGTSASNNGANSGVSFDPPWLDEIDFPELPEDDSETQDDQEDDTTDILAPPARYRSARLALTEYIKTGDHSSLKKSLGNYSRIGMGGASRLAKRMSISTRSASRLFHLLNDLSQNKGTEISRIISDIQKSSGDSDTIISTIITNLCPSGGSLDEVSCRDSMQSALSDLYERTPDVDITNLGIDSIWELISSYLGYETYNRIINDIGQKFDEIDANINDIMLRKSEVKSYLDMEIASQIDQLRNKTTSGVAQDIKQIAKIANERTFAVFEEEI